MRAKTGKFRKCLICGNSFYKSPSVYKKGEGMYCSRKCYYKSQTGKPAWNSGLKGEGYRWKGTVIKNNCKCIICDKGFHLKPFAIKRGRGKCCSKPCYSKLQAQRMRGEGNHQHDQHWGKGVGNPNWRGGVGRLPYGFDFSQELRELIRKRDNYKCQLCQTPQEECFRKLTIHHIDYDKQNSDPKNLIALCSRCNSKVNFNREAWTSRFREVMSTWHQNEL